MLPETASHLLTLLEMSSQQLQYIIQKTKFQATELFSERQTTSHEKNLSGQAANIRVALVKQCSQPIYIPTYFKGLRQEKRKSATTWMVQPFLID